MNKTIFLERDNVPTSTNIIFPLYTLIFHYLTTSCVMFRPSSAYKARCVPKNSRFVFGVHVQALPSRKRTVEISDRMSVRIVLAWDTTDEVLNRFEQISVICQSCLTKASYVRLRYKNLLFFYIVPKYMSEYNYKQLVVYVCWITRYD